jgi:FkbM family methyltransferase
MMALRDVLRRPRALVRAAGFDVVRYRRILSPADGRRLAAIRRGGISIVLDVGASGGDFGRKLRASGYEGEILSFEPLRASFEVLQRNAEGDPRWRVFHTAVGDREDTAEMNVSGTSVSSSLLPMESLHIRSIPASIYVGVERVEVQRLDTLLSNLPGAGSGPYYLKIDVQGYENRVLDGARDALRKVSAIELEISMRSLYEGSSLYVDMFTRLQALGFSLVSWEDVMIDPETGFVLQADCIFVI